MELFLYLVAGVLTATVPFLIGYTQRAGRIRSWYRAARESGLTELAPSGPALLGRAGALGVCFKDYFRHRDEKGTCIVLDGLGHGPSELAFRKASVATVLQKKLTRGQEIALGDAAFDRAVYLQGSPELACALLDGATRAELWRLMERAQTRVTLADGALRIELRESGRSYRASETLPVALSLAKRLQRPHDLAVRLADNARTDTITGVRMANLRGLLQTYPRHDQTREALLAACADADDEVRLLAATALGVDGWDTLLQLASAERTDDAQAARAVEALGDHLAVERATEILFHALRRRRLATAQACLEWLGRRGGTEVVETLAKVLAVEKSVLGMVAAQALGATGRAEAELPLIAALAADSPEALAALAEALARVGTVGAVMPLRAAMDRVRNGDFHRAARQAIAEIQSRQQGASPGQLSLATGEGGQVSLPDDAGGQLSLPEDKPR